MMTISKRLVAPVLLAGLLLSGRFADAAEEKPLTLEQIEILLQSGLPHTDIGDQILQRGVVPFELGAEQLRRLEEQGAGKTVVFILALKLGQEFTAAGEFELAVEHFILADKLIPNNPNPWKGIANVWNALGDYAKALEYLDKALELAPNDAGGAILRISLLVNLRQYGAALQAAVAVIENHPAAVEGYRFLSLLLAAIPDGSARDGNRAIAAARKALELEESWINLHVLACALAEAGQFDEAVKIQELALANAPDSRKPAMTTWLENFRSHVPFRLDEGEPVVLNTGVRPDGPPPLSSPQDPVTPSVAKLLQDQMVEIPGGTFLMGTKRPGLDFEDEAPQHEESVEPFLLSRFEVTNRLYALVLDGTAEGIINPDHPVEGVSFEDAQRFINQLNRMAGADIFRLPTEVEWEYAARAGSKETYYFGDSPDDLESHAWYQANSDHKAHPVGELQANEFKLFDMYGNVGEWCRGEYSDYRDADSEETEGFAGSLRVFRGGSWANSADYCRSAVRGVSAGDDRRKGIGFRIACDDVGLDFSGGNLSASGREGRIAELTEKYQADSNDGAVARELANLLFQRGQDAYKSEQYARSVEDLSKSIDIAPRSVAPSYVLLCWILATCPEDAVRDGERAVEYGKVACGITHWDEWEALHALAAAYAEKGDFAKAANRERRAIDLASSDAKEVCRERLKLYEEQKPVRATETW